MRWLPFAVVLASACTPSTVTTPDKPQVSARATPERPGAALYERYCQLCHGKEGVGSAAENANALSNVDFLASVSDAFLRLAIHRGRPGTSMAAYSDAYGGPLSAAQVDEIIGYLRSFAEGAPVDLPKEVNGDASAGAPIYRDRCASCHGDQGQGASAPSISHPLFLASASDGFIRYAIERGRRGTAMPAFGNTLSPQQLDDLTRTVRAMVRNVDTTPPTGEVPPTFDTVVVNATGPTPELEPLIDGRYVPAARVAAALAAAQRGAAVLRVHDVAATVDALKVWRSLQMPAERVSSQSTRASS
jgi:cytochrome c oxidase cbb3-type subunit 3/ubiquinol-cytochrome c reductase cytochrome c subunit